MKTYLDKDSDLWVEADDGIYVLITEATLAAARVGDVSTGDYVRESFGPLVELAARVPVTAHGFQVAVDAFNAADFTGCGNASWEDSHLHVGLRAALAALGIEVAG